METAVGKRVFIVTLPHDDPIVFDGSREELDKYLIDMSQWNNVRKDKIRVVDSFVVQPVYV